MVAGGRPRRRWALVLATLLLALAAAATFGPGLLNLERYRDQIARQVGRAIGREVSVGAITASVWRLGAEARGIRVAERPGHGRGAFLEAEALRVRVELLPLLRGNLRVATAVLERPRIRLVRDRAGRWNVEDLWAGPPAGPPTPPGRPAPDAARAPRGAAGALLVKDLRARDGEVQLEGLMAGPAGAPPLVIRNLRLEARQEDPRGAVALELVGEVAGGALEAAVTLAPQGPALAVDGRLSLKGMDLAALEPYVSKGRASGPADIQVTAKGTLPSLDLSGEADLGRARLDLGTAARKGPGEEGHLAFAGKLAGEGIDLPKVRLRWRGLRAEGRLAVARFTPLEATFAAHANRVDLDALLAPPGGAGQGRGGEAGGGAPGIFRAGAAWAAPAPAPRGPSGAGPGDVAGAAGPHRVDGVLRAGTVAWRGLDARDMRASLAYRDAVLSVRDVTGTLAGGRLEASGSVDLRGRSPALALTFRLADARLQALVAAARPGSPVRAEGIVTADGKITAPVLGPGNAVGALAGSGSIVVRDGRVAGYRPLERLADVLASAARGTGLLKSRLDEFQRLSATYTLEKGSLRTRDLTLARADGQATAAGSVNLVDSSLDFDVAVRLGKVSVEAKVLGTAEDPVVVPTVARLEKRFEMELDRALKGDRGRKVQELLRNLLR